MRWHFSAYVVRFGCHHGLFAGLPLRAISAPMSERQPLHPEISRTQDGTAGVMQQIGSLKLLVQILGWWMVFVTDEAPIRLCPRMATRRIGDGLEIKSLSPHIEDTFFFKKSAAQSHSLPTVCAYYRTIPASFPYSSTLFDPDSTAGFPCTVYCHRFECNLRL